MKNIKQYVEKISEYCLLGLLGIYLFYESETATTLNLPFGANFTKNILTLTYIFTIIHTVIILKDKSKEIVLAIIFSVLYRCLYLINNFEFFKFLSIFVIAFVGTDYRNIIKVFLFSEGILLLITVIITLIGARTNYVYSRNGQIRSSWGIIYPTDFASFLLYLCMFFWALCPDGSNRSDGIGIGLSFLCTMISWKIAGSRTSMIISVMWEFCCLCKLLHRNILRKSCKIISYLNKIIIFTFPICCILFFLCMFFYDKGYVVKLNTLTSSRISLAVNAFNTYGSKPFGTSFEMIGAGGTTDFPSNYNFIDDSYALILIRYGWIILTVFLFMWPMLTKKQLDAGHQNLAIVMSMIAIHSLSEHHFIEPHFNILLMMPFAMYDNCEKSYTFKINKSLTIANDMTVIVFAIISLLFGPRMLNWGRTIVQGYSFLMSYDWGWRLFIGLLIIVIVTIMFLNYICRILCSAVQHTKISKKMFIRITWTSIFVLSFFVLCNYLINDIMQKKGNTLNADTASIHIIESAKTGRLYSDIYPEIYKRKFQKFDCSIFSGDELARYSNTSVIVCKDYYSNIMEIHSFKYAQISNEYGVYTNDPNVIQVLQNNNYQFRD